MNTNPTLLPRLRREIKGEILTDTVSLGLYATDASQYQITPILVVVPVDRADAEAAVRICGELTVPILARGSGTSLSGQTIAQAVVIDFSKYMNKLLEVNTEQRWARVQPGLVRDELNTLLRPHALHFAPDPATSNRANVGGMISNNSGGMRSNKYGTTIDHVIELDVALPSGEILKLGAVDEAGLEKKCAQRGQEGDIYRTVRRICAENKEEIGARYSKARRRSSGYMLDHMLVTPFNLAKLISASEGTLGVILEAKVKLEPNPKASGLMVSHFGTIPETLMAVGPLVEHRPSSVELLDKVILGLARDSLLGRELSYFVEGRPAAILITEVEDDTAEAVAQRLGAAADDMRARGMGYVHKLMLDEKSKADVWKMRHNGLGLMTTIKGERKPVPFIEDAAVPLDQLPAYIQAVLRVCEKYGRTVSIFAHAGVGLIHVRPMLDLHKASELQVMRDIADEVFDLVMAHKGALSGEHGDGIVRGGFNERYFGPRLYAAFREIKSAFDPQWLMNPGKIVDAPSMTENLRFGQPGYANLFGETMFHYRSEEGMQKAVEQCTGVGACRKTGTGVMCPSYIATRDEEHSTRGRANALRLAMSGQLGGNAFGSPRVKEVFDLCISCKACKNECPNSVDMAKLKAEFMHAYYKSNGTPLREKLFAAASKTALKSSGDRAAFTNFVLGLPPVRWFMDQFLGIDARRPLPQYSSTRLSEWHEAREKVDRTGRPRVALFNDTYIEHHQPEVGRAAIEVLEALGYDVMLVNAGCCQRPAMSKGLLHIAKAEGTETLRRLEELVPVGIPILAVEPSCASALADDLPDLVDDEMLGKRIGSRVELLDNFVARALAEHGEGINWKNGAVAGQTIHVHGHCHQKALFTVAGTLGMLRHIPGSTIKPIEAGCCGMAGSFGYEKEHYEMSRKIGEDRLLPYLRKVPGRDAVAACGFSCRHQIADFGDKKAKHPIEYVREAMEIEAAQHTTH